jgi:hypothetical protein
MFSRSLVTVLVIVACLVALAAPVLVGPGIGGLESRRDDTVITLLKYRSGEEIKKGDRVLFHGNPAEIELVAFDPNDSKHAWHVQ